MHTDGDTEQAADHKRPNASRLDVLALLPDCCEVQQQSASGDEYSGLQRIDVVQPDRRCRKAEGKSGSASRYAADKCAEP